MNITASRINFQFISITIYCIIFLQLITRAQETPKILLMDENIQFEATEAVNNMYNFKFEKAEQEFQVLKYKYPNHPMPYFLMGLSNWWKIMPTLDTDMETYADVFVSYMDSTILFAEKIFDKDESNYEAAFFLSAAYGLKARYFGENGKYGKATINGKNALSYLQKYSNENQLSPEFLFGKSLFNYYAVWIKDNYTLLRPILAFFPSGDKEKGIKQLKEVAYNAFYTRVEAQYFLMRIYGIEEDKEELALPIARYLATTFPDNAYFQRCHARYSFSQGQWGETEKVAEDILYKLNIGMPGYEAISGRYASFYLGRINMYKYRNYEKAKSFYYKTVKFAQETKATKMNYFLYALADLGKIADEEKDYKRAKEYYQLVLKGTDNKDALHKDAKAYLSTHKK
ncbi:MAG: tol-pal system protein YbgF [Cytophagales bacterium]|nr:MAG: tol-pal system protein YbgF [Cytophagales bacterium]